MKKLLEKPAATKARRRIPADIMARIDAALDRLAEEPRPANLDIKAMQGRSDYRLRVGDYRVIFEETETAITVTAIGRRGDIYD